MNTDIWTYESLHLVGESATCPSEPRCGRLAALLLLVGMSPPRRRPCRAHPRLQARVVAQAHSKLSESPAAPLPNTHIAAHSGTFNCRF